LTLPGGCPHRVFARITDTSFGSGGIGNTSFFGILDLGSRIDSVILQPNGKLVVAGRVDSLLGTPDFALARYDTNGALDLSFGSNGKMITDFFGGGDEANALAVQPDGKLIAAGSAFGGIGLEFAIARYQTDIPTQPDFTLSFDQPTVVATRGTKVGVTLNINRIGGFSGDVTLTPPEPSMGIKPKPSVPITTAETSVKFKMKITASASTGEHELSFTGKDDSGRLRTVTLQVLVE
jgi:uncharacterized delta-60 repeat protein